MSGHSHWATHKRDKFANDAKRSAAFTKVSRAITIAAKEGGGDPSANASLRLAIDKAREANMPKDKIERAIDKGLGISSTGQQFEDVVYEGYGPSGVAFYVKATTDNRNRTVSEVRNIFSRFGGSLGTSGSTAYIFSADPENPSFNVDFLAEDEVVETLVNLFDELEGLDDVSEVFANFNVIE